jgi:molybdopterin-binding protein
MAISARNQLRGQIKDVKLGNVMADVVIAVGDHEIESVIARRSAEELDLKPGDNVTAIVLIMCWGNFERSSSVMVRGLPSSPSGRLANRNCREEK